MLVLLIIFMISAPLLTTGVQVELPRTEAAAVKDTSQPITVTIKRDGTIFVRDDAVTFADLGARLQAASGGADDKPIYVRADGGAPYADVARVMARLQGSGFSKIDLITDTAPAPRDPQ